MRLAIVLIVAGLAAACTREQKPEDPAPQPKKPSTAQQAVEGFTGQTAVKQGKMAREKIENVSDQKNKDLDEIM